MTMNKSRLILLAVFLIGVSIIISCNFYTATVRREPKEFSCPPDVYCRID